MVLKDNVRDPQVRETLFNKFAAEKDGEVKRVFQTVLNGGVLQLPEPAAQAIAHNPLIEYVEQDAMVWATETQSNPPWGLDRVDQPSLPLASSYTYNATGYGVTAYVIDTGIRADHNEFDGRVSLGIDVFGGDGSDCNGHGTHVAGIIGGKTYGIAKEVDLVTIRVMDCNGSGSVSGVISGIDWATRDKNASKAPAVANISLTGSASRSLDRAVSKSIRSGIVYAVATGNNNANACNYSPARVSTAITVGARAFNDDRASYSNYGKCLDIFAPGTAITSAWNSSTTATNTISGTSMATPHIAGVAALYLDLTLVAHLPIPATRSGLPLRLIS